MRSERLIVLEVAPGQRETEVERSFVEFVAASECDCVRDCVFKREVPAAEARPGDVVRILEVQLAEVAK